MKKYYCYKTTTGEIISIGESTNGINEGAFDVDGVSFSNKLGEANPLIQYVLSGVLTDRPLNNITIDKTVIAGYDQEKALLSGVVSGAILDVSFQQFTTDGTDIELSFYEPKEYTIRVTNFPDTDYEVKINAN